MFRQRPGQKAVFVTQNGFLPLMDLLDIPKSRVICAVLQLINEIVKDNTDFLENACLVGLVSPTLHLVADFMNHQLFVGICIFVFTKTRIFISILNVKHPIQQLIPFWENP
jgi:hypothetical protein